MSHQSQALTALVERASLLHEEIALSASVAGSRDQPLALGVKATLQFALRKQTAKFKQRRSGSWSKECNVRGRHHV